MRTELKLLVAHLSAIFRPLVLLIIIREASKSSNLIIRRWGKKWLHRFDPDVLRKLMSFPITRKSIFFKSESQGNLNLELSEHIDYTIFMQGYFDNFILEHFIHNNPKQIILLDVGANIGAISISAALRGAQVIAFEPNPTICEKFSANIKANSLNNITLIQTALGNQNQANLGQIELYIQPANSGTSSMISSWNDGKRHPKKIHVKITTLDDFLGQYPLVHSHDQECILKIDVEGMELNVLEGAMDFLNDFSPVIVMEWRHNLIQDPIQLRQKLKSEIPNYIFYSGKNLVKGILQEFEFDETEENIVGYSIKSHNP